MRGRTSLRRVPETPYLTIHLGRVRENFYALHAALPDARIRYAVKANPAEPILRLLAAEGAAFDVASIGEIDACTAAAIDGWLLTFGNTIKKPADIARAFSSGVRRFTFDTNDGAAAIAEHAPGSSVECRIAPELPSSVTPFGHKFGCAPTEAVDLLDYARALGLRPEGVCFHVGSQQLDPGAWELGIRTVLKRSSPHLATSPRSTSVVASPPRTRPAHRNWTLWPTPS